MNFNSTINKSKCKNSSAQACYVL